MRIAFHGAARTVTGSKHLVTLKNGTQMLLDCGMFQGLSEDLTDSWNSSFGFEADKVNYLLLSHAHIDHSGLIPKLVKDGFRGKIICTAATHDLVMLLLQDSADIQRNENQVQRTQRSNNEEVSEPLYTLEDVAKTAELFEIIQFEEWLQLEEGLEIYYTNTGHIIGSAAITIRVTEDEQTKTFHFSVEGGRYRDGLLCPPQCFPQSDFIIIESTYGNSVHENQFGTTDQLMKWIKHT